MADTVKTFDEELESSREKFISGAQQMHDTVAGKNTETTNTYINDMNAVVDANTQRATEKVEKQIEAVPQQYQSGYDMNAIQQKINERQVAERMANLGLTNSGLNRTQQTAINVQRSNADAALTRQKNATISSLRSQIADIVASAASQKNSFAAEAKYNTGMQNNALYSTLMQNAEQNAINRANTIDDRNYNTAERIAQQEYNTSERLASQEYNSAEAEKDRQFSTSERLASQEYSTSERLAQQKYNSAEAQKDRESDKIITALKNGGSVSLDEDGNVVINNNGNDEEREKYADWESGQWESYFANIRKTHGIEAAEKELEEFTQNGWIPNKMVVYASIGARGKLGH